ncbi:hypothetical protein MMC31_004832, partial [Peltigera leucophlebia]|nr:hypothetical protein [Peltigera leucophlebia]
MTTSAPKWDELVPIPLIFDVKARIEFLKSILIPGNPCSQHPRQHPNIEAAIAMYESGKLDGSRVLIVGGKVVSSEEALKAGLPVWGEGGSYHQFSSQKASYPYDPQMSGHALLIEVRLLTAYGGQGLLRRMPVLWDTGSNILSMFDHDLLALAGNQETIDR